MKRNVKRLTFGLLATAATLMVLLLAGFVYKYLSGFESVALRDNQIGPVAAQGQATAGPAVTASQNAADASQANIGTFPTRSRVSGQVSSPQTATNTLEVTVAPGGQTKKLPFQAVNLYPGDMVQHTFAITVRHQNPVGLNFMFIPDVDASQQLLKQLKMRVFVAGLRQPLADATFEAFSEQQYALQVQVPAGNLSEVVYSLEVYLPVSAGNECANQRIAGTFTWNAAELSENESAGIPSITSPKTGDWFRPELLAFFSLGSLALFLFLLSRRKKNRKGDETL